MKIPPIGARLFHVGGRTDMTKLGFFPLLPTRQKTRRTET